MKTKLFSGILAVLVLFSAVSAHALKYDSSPGSALSAGESTTFSFLPAAADFQKAKLSLDIDSLTNSTSSAFGKTATVPASGQFFTLTGDKLTYLFTTDFHLGRNTFKLNDFLGSLNAANTATGLTFGLLLDRGSIVFNNARLRGTVAPEPVSMALMAAGMVGLPFVRRLRNSIKA